MKALIFGNIILYLVVITQAYAIEMPIYYEAEPPKYDIIEAEISAFNNEIGQTDSTPNIMASGKRVYEGAVACPSWLELGTQIEIKGRRYTCEDRMAKRYRYKNNFDIFMFSKSEALRFGRRNLAVKIIK